MLQRILGFPPAVHLLTDTNVKLRPPGIRPGAFLRTERPFICHPERAEDIRPCNGGGKWFVGAIHESPVLRDGGSHSGPPGRRLLRPSRSRFAQQLPQKGSGRTGRSFLTSHSSLAWRAQATRPTVGVAGDRTRRGTGPRPMSSNRARRGMRLPRRCDPRNDIRKLHRNGHS